MSHDAWKQLRILLLPFKDKHQGMESIEKCRRAPSLLRFIFSATGLRIALSMVDTATDVYATYRYSVMEGQMRNVAFYGLLVSLVFHNLVSTLHGLRNLARAHRAHPLKMLDVTWWRCLLVFVHLSGLGNIMIPLSLIFSAKEFSGAQYQAR